MSLEKTLLLGFIAGVTIVIGLPIGRLGRAMPALRAFLNAVAIGVLLFLVWDVLSAAWEPIDIALGKTHDHTGGIAPVLGYGLLFAGGISVGLLSLVAYQRWMSRPPVVGDRTKPEPIGTGGSVLTATAQTAVRTDPTTWSPAKRLCLLIAVGIGLHNFAEGLAIGQAAAGGEIALATLLVVGFALHNATEGFGIVAPLAAEVDADGQPSRPSWAFLLTMAAIGGGPTFVGTAVGHNFTSEPVSVVFLTLAAGSIIYVITQLLDIAGRVRRPDILARGILIGLLAGFATDAIVTAAGI